MKILDRPQCEQGAGPVRGETGGRGQHEDGGHHRGHRGHSRGQQIISVATVMTNPENYALFQDVEEAQETQETSFEGGGATWYTGEGGEGADCDSPRGAVQDV